jgi:beta-glucosidase
VLLTGRALAVPELLEKPRAVVHAFFPGIEGGSALADVLFGDYNPGGKEPVTWPRSVGQLPIHHYDPPNGRPNIPERGDYKAHWLDESDEPLVPFGFGLSYTTFSYSALELPPELGREEGLTIRVRVANTGTRDGDEVVQVYARPQVSRSVAGKKLIAYRRVPVRKGESIAVEFKLPSTALAVLDPDNQWTLFPGRYDLLVGGSSSRGLAGTLQVVDMPRAVRRTANLR